MWVTILVILFTVVLGCMIPAILYPAETLKWIRIKRYRWEVTTGIFLFTQTEKFIFDSFVFLTLSIFLIACALYLPTHLRTIAERAVYYFSGLPPTGFSAGLSSKIASAGHAAADGMHYVRDAMHGATSGAASAGVEAAQAAQAAHSVSAVPEVVAAAA